MRRKPNNWAGQPQPLTEDDRQAAASAGAVSSTHLKYFALGMSWALFRSGMSVPFAELAHVYVVVSKNGTAVAGPFTRVADAESHVGSAIRKYNVADGTYKTTHIRKNKEWLKCKSKLKTTL